MYLTFDFDPMLSIPVKQQVIEKAGMRQEFPNSNSKIRDLSGYVTNFDWDLFNSEFDAMTKTERADELFEIMCHIATMVYSADEKISEDIARKLIETAIDTQMYIQLCQKRAAEYEPGKIVRMTETVTVLDDEKSTSKHRVYKTIEQNVEKKLIPKNIVLSLAASACYDVNLAIFTASMELNLQNFRYIFPTSVIAHDPVHIIRRLENPNYEMTPADTKKHFATRADQSFPIMNSFSIYEVLKTCDKESQVLQSAGRYQLLKRSFEDAKIAAQEASEPTNLSKKLVKGSGDASE